MDVLLLEDTGQGREKLHSSRLAAGGQVVVLPEAQENREGDEEMPLPVSLPTDKVYSNVVLGGTFGQPHVGHWVMFSGALLQCNGRLVCGIADGSLLRKKTLTELIRPLEERMAGLAQLVEELDPSAELHAVPIEEPLGPTAWDPNMDMLVVSEETKGGSVAAINRVREEKGLPLLEGHVVTLVQDEEQQSTEEETKASSSSGRMRLLGTILWEPTQTCWCCGVLINKINSPILSW